MLSGAFRAIAVVLAGIALQFLCSEPAYAVLPNPTAITPNNGVFGDTVTVTGSAFTLNPLGPTLKFTTPTGTALATVISWDNTHIVATVPSAASTGPITVTASGGSKTSTFNFTVNLPRIDSFSPGADLPGASVTIYGANFSQAQNIVRFNNNSTPAINTVTCTFPPPPPATQTPPNCYKLTATVNATATTGRISAKVGSNNTATSLTDFIVAPRPQITNLSATLGPVGLAITISGSNFAASSAGDTVKFNGTAAVASPSSNATTIYTNVPIGATTGPVIVTVNSAISENNPIFTVVPPASISSVSPAAGPAGIDVTISGQNFAPTLGGNTVTFNGAPAVIKPTSSSTNLVVTVPAQATTGPIAVTSFGFGATNTVTFGVMRITALNPPFGGVNAPVTISGENFGATSAADTVKFNGAVATVLGTSNSTQINTIVPAGALNGPVSVTVNGFTITSSRIFSVLGGSSSTTLQYGDDGRLRQSTSP